MNCTESRRRRWPFFLLLALIAVSLLLHVEKSRRRSRVRAAQERFAAMVAARPIAKVKAGRARFYQVRFFLGYPLAASYAAADLVRRIHAIAPPLRLLGIEVDPGLHDLDFALTVEVASLGPREARRRLAVFLERLRDIPIVTSADFPGLGPTARSGEGRVFTVNGRAELQP